MGQRGGGGGGCSCSRLCLCPATPSPFLFLQPFPSPTTQVAGCGWASGVHWSPPLVHNVRFTTRFVGCCKTPLQSIDQ